ncbi:hypothetical protein KDK95_14685 [Actinospica sp. MGRD01-02]|uniref:Uncharacterized protein n=1 Tax=Actinospica acidithermotolerans TaxID=2828514 RepID=A0A941IJ74_9ACTN|nr:hypothetical protein [Actinospica acidithermotolerans]MBR7827562.1 hypothetical protein [Actinospica acidithermotolerans]
MNLWERDIFPRHDELDQLTAPTRLRIAVEAIDWTLRTSTTPIRYQAAADWIEEVMTEARAAVAEQAGHVDLSEDLAEQFDEVDEDADETGVSQLLMGVANVYEFDSFTSKALEGTLFACYVFSQQREVPEPETIEEEEAVARCREVIAHQQRLIETAAGW